MHVELIAGSRDYEKLYEVENYVWNVLPSRTLVITGGAIGVDHTAHLEARDRGLYTKVFPVTNEEWMLFGAFAGPMRNMHMIEYMNLVRSKFPTNTYRVMIFSHRVKNGKLTPGSQSMFDIATRHDYDVSVYGES